MSVDMIGVDVGGTFTDCIAVKGGAIHTVKVLADASARERPVIEGAKALGLEGIAVFNHATTIGLNAVLTRDLPKVAFLTTSGHRDMLDMGRAWRPLSALTDPHWRRSFGDVSRPLVPRYLRRGIDERILTDGSIMMPLDEDQARSELEVLRRCGVQGVAICLLNSYVTDAHERRLSALVAEVLGDVPCSISSDVSPLAKEYARASSTVVDVLMKLTYTRYTDALVEGLAAAGFAGQLNFADCAASLTPVEHAMDAPLRIMFSGPAAGTVSSAFFGAHIESTSLICCDIGGTSCDISLVIDGQPRVNTTFEIEHDLIVNTLAGEIATIGAGGGSIISVTDEGELRVGPDSAGGDPGPACYGRGGTAPTTTDACLMIGILDESQPLGGTLTLDRTLAVAAFEGLDSPLSLDDRIAHSYALALNNISEGIVEIAVGNGLDPRDYALVAYGSAGPMLLPAVLEHVGARSVVVPPHPGLFSALGLLSTDLVFTDNRSAYMVLDDDAASRIDRVFAEMEKALFVNAGIEDTRDVEVLRTFDARLVGQTWETPFAPAPNGTIDDAAVRQMVGSFHDVYEERWGSRFDRLPVEGVTYRVQVVVPTEKVVYPELPAATEDPVSRRSVQLSHLAGRSMDAREYIREDLRAGHRLFGPAVIREPMATTYVCAGQVAEIGRYGEIVITQENA